MTDIVKDVSIDITKIITATSIKNNETHEKLNEKVLELMNDEGMIAASLASSSVNPFKPENKSKFKLLGDHNSIRVNDVLINGGLQVTLYSKMATFRESKKPFILDRDLLETMTIYDFNVSHSTTKDQKLIYDFGKEKILILSRKKEKVAEINLI